MGRGGAVGLEAEEGGGAAELDADEGRGAFEVDADEPNLSTSPNNASRDPGERDSSPWMSSVRSPTDLGLAGVLGASSAASAEERTLTSAATFCQRWRLSMVRLCLES